MNEGIWFQSPSLTLRGIKREVPLWNFAGLNYMAYVDTILADQLGIKSSERVLDIGGGATPFSRADVVTEAYLDDDTHRIGRPISKSKDYVECFAEKLPFADHEFDVAVSRHVFEHATDPEAACREIARVARRGYIETPSPWSEFFYGYPPHRWLISVEDNVLVFRPRPFVRSPFLNCLRWMEYRDADFSFRWNLEYRNLITTQFPWEGEIRCRVESGPGFDYDDPEQAAESHVSFVINALRFGAPASELEYEIRAALRLRPESALAQNTLGIVLWLAKRYEESRAAFREAFRLDPNDDIFRRNAGLLQTDRPKLKMLPPEPLDNGTPAENFAGRVFYSSSIDYDSLLRDQLAVTNDETVLGVAGGERHFEKANTTVNVAKNTVFPFADGSFDVAFARGALEQAENPAKICSEMQRVAERGFIEVPRAHWEYIYGNPRNRWLCEERKGVLVLRRKRFAKIPFKSVIVPLLLQYPDLRHRFEVSLRNLTHIQLPWQGGFEYRVEDDPACPYDYRHPADALLAHLDYGYNLSNQGAAAAALPEAEAVLAIDGNHPDGLNMRGVVAWALGRHEEGLEYVGRAAELAPNNKLIQENYRFMRDEYAKMPGNDNKRSDEPDPPENSHTPRIQ